MVIVARPPLRALVCPTTLAISGEAHRDGQRYHEACAQVMYRSSELAVTGFVRFIAGLGVSVDWNGTEDLRVIRNIGEKQIRQVVGIGKELLIQFL
jgi:hypothetical protein